MSDECSESGASASTPESTATRSGLDSCSVDYGVLQDALVWGYLTPNCSLFRSFRLVSDSVVFGKQGLSENIVSDDGRVSDAINSNCSSVPTGRQEADQFYALREEEFPPALFPSLSRRHFKIERIFDGDEYDVFVTDLSCNGT
jgi:hypothetical protein